ncbi:MAG: metal-sensitive transcriptional regulator [Phycisphaeraceae bacterium]
MDDQTRDNALRRLAIAKGQLDGVERMIRDDKYCVDVLTQIAAVHQALRGIGRLIVDNHLHTCVRDAVQQGDDEQQLNELMDIIYKLTK